MSEIVYVTEEGLAKMKEELNHLVAIERPNASKAIGEAREKGDLSENAEYDAAKEAQGLLELRIRKLEGDIGNARVLDASKIDISKVSVLSKVKVLNLKMKKEFTYHLVSEKEADLKQMKISVKSPIGSALLGLKKGEKTHADHRGWRQKFLYLGGALPDFLPPFHRWLCALCLG